MFDRTGIYERFAECHSVVYTAELARLHGISKQTAHSWKTGKNPIPWERLKALVEKQGLSWDWLLEGKAPKFRKVRKEVASESFDRHAINQRFLSLFPPEMSQAKIAMELGVHQTTVHKWECDKIQVSWERLKFAIDHKGATWEWLLEGR